MVSFFRLIASLKNYKLYTFFGLFFQFLAAVFTLISIPMVIPFFQILFGKSPSEFSPPENYLDLESLLNYGFSRLIAMSDRYVALTIVCISIVVIIFLRNLCRYFSSYFILPAINGLVRDLRNSLFRAFTQMTMTTRYAYKKGHLLSLISNDIAEVDHGVLKALEMLLKVPLVVLGSTLFMVWISPQLAFVAFSLILFVFIVIGGLSLGLKKSSYEAQEQMSEIQSISDEYLTGAGVIQAYNAQGYFMKKFDKKNQYLYALANRILRRRDLASPLSEFLGVIVVVVLLWYGAQLVFKSELEPTTFFAFIFAFYNVIDPAKNLSREFYNVQKGIAALERINRFTSQWKSNKSKCEHPIPVTYSKNIHFRNVSFRYDSSEKYILKDFDLIINKGQKIGLVGLSGSGKTTILNLLLRFYSPEDGKIFMDEKQIEQFGISEYRQLFGLVTQEAILFHLSILENITLNDSEVNIVKVKNAVKMAYASDFIQDSYGGLEKIVGDAGVKLSGGERQRIAIARAIYHDPEIMILDEPTSALDLDAQTKVQDALFEAMHDRTTIMVSHNMELLKRMDRIVVINNGQIAQEGNFEKLKSEPGIFSDLLFHSHSRTGKS